MQEADFQALDDLLDGLREHHDEVPQWEFCEGFMAAMIACRRRIPQAEYMGALLCDESGQFGPQLFKTPEDHAQFLALWQKRWDEIQASLEADVQSLDDERAYAPEVVDVRGAVANMSEEERAAMAQELGDEELPAFAQVWALGFMFAVETWPEEWEPPRDKELAKAVEGALDTLVSMTEDDTGEPTVCMFGEDGAPSVSADRLNLYGDAMWAVYDLFDVWRAVGPRVATVVKGDTPGRNDPCSCGSGKKYKKCCGA